MTFAKIQAAEADIQARKEAGATGGRLFFSLQPGETAIIRFIDSEEEVEAASGWVHELPADPGKQFGPKLACRDQAENGDRNGEACPGCQKGYKRTFRGAVNLIWRDAPVFERDSNNRLVRDQAGKLIVQSKQDQVAVWTSGITVFGTLAKKAITYKGLESRDFRVTRSGTGLQTNYEIEPADPDGGPKEMSKADAELAKEKNDNSDLMAKPSYETWGQQSGQQGQQRAEAPPQADVSPFMRNRS